MKVLQINIFGNLSTGKIAVDIYRTLKANGHDGMVAFARNKISEDVPHIIIGSSVDVKLHGLMTRITDKTGLYSKKATKKFIDEIEKYKPDIVHLHNIHGYYINYEILFRYLKRKKIPVVWTLHDCWTFTGHCAYFDRIGCERWKTGCHHCPQKKSYPASYLIDNSSWNYNKKKEIFSDMPNLTIVSVAKWLDNLVGESYLKNYPRYVFHNGIDLTVFKPTASYFREQFHLKDRIIILGVASTWDTRKGLADFIKLSDLLDDSYQIVVVGISKKQKNQLPSKIIGIERTNDIKELAGLYSTADIYANLTYEDVFPTTNLEALACGTPVLAYETGGCPEATNDTCGVIVRKGDIKEAARTIIRMTGEYEEKKCLERAKNFTKEKCFQKYIELYECILNQV